MVGQQISNSMPLAMNRLPLFSGLFLAESGQLMIPEGFRGSIQTKGELSLFFIASGKGIFLREGKNIAVQQNDVFFQPAGADDVFCTDLETSASIWYLDVYGDGVESFMETLSLEPGMPVISGISSPLFYQAMKAVVLFNHPISLADHMHVLSGLYKVLAILLEGGSSLQWTRVPYSDKKILYTGSWTVWPSPFDGNHNERYTATARAYAEYNFFGSGIKWIGTSNFDCGKADVILDGNYQTTIDTYSPTRLTQQILYMDTSLSEGHHIIKIFCTGEKNDKATNCDIVIESFQYSKNCGGVHPVKIKNQAGYSRMTQKAMEYMRANYMKAISIEQLASMLKVSRSYFSNRFTNELGQSPIQFLTQIRLEQSKLLLTDTEEGIAQIASAVGYGDAFYFSNLFHRKENLSPTQYRLLHCRLKE